MRNLVTTNLSIADYSSLGGSSSVAGIAVDPESGVGYVAVERSEDGVEVEILRMDTANPTDFPEIVATIPSLVAAPFELPSYRSQVLDVHFFPDDRSLVVILAGGDIATVQMDQANGEAVDIVGSVDSGIKAAAWSPDDEQLVLVTGEDNVVCMTRLFDIVHEEPLRTEDFGEDKFINVGWGSKTTQFHGSLGKAAARQAAESSTSSKPASLSHPSDDGLPIVTFRGDAAFFAISSLDFYADSNLSRRQVRIYACSAGSPPKLSATSESLPGLEGPLTWRPSGNIISGLVRYGYEGGASGSKGRWEVAMLERNGLRHGGFELREGVETWDKGRVRGMSWNADSEILAIWLERPDEDVVQLWTMKNYHYYSKQEIFSHKPSSKRFKGIKWHPEQPLTLYIMGQDSVQVRNLAWDTFTSGLPMPNDSASVAVIDGKRLLVTPFRTQNTPPPMSSYVIDLPATPVNVSFSASHDSLAVVFADGKVQAWDLNTKLPDPKSGSRLRGGGRVAEPKLSWEGDVKPENGGLSIGKQIAFANGEVAVLFWSEDDGSLVVTARDNQKGVPQKFPANAERLVWAGESAGWLVLADDMAISPAIGNEYSVELCANPLDFKFASDMMFALSPSGKLLASLNDSEAATIATSVTSFTFTDEYLIYTTTAHMSFYAPLDVVREMSLGGSPEPWELEWESRRIERGALAVVACPSSMSLVLQMPRGNLETIYPRPLVLAVVRRDVLRGAYRDALITCRKHRLDLNILHDLDPAKFMASLDSLVEQVPEVDYLNLFTSSLNDNDCSIELYRDLKRSASTSSTKISPTKVNDVCDALRAALEKRDMLKYTETILTTHVCKQPADYESGLRVLLRLQKEHPEVVEDAVKYIIFLSDVNQLYDVALGMYDFQLVLMVAQYSQKDPKEYLPFLKELRELSKWEQRFRIDDHLGRKERALRSLQQAGPSRFEDAASYLARYELYDEAFRLYKGDEERLPTIYDLYGDYLYDRRDFYESAIAYTLSGKPQKALKAYERAHAWRELFALALQEEVSKKGIAEMVERVADHLASRGRHIEAAQAYLDYTQDVDSAVQVLCSGTDFAEANRIIALHKRDDLTENHVWPGMDDAQEGLVEVFDEMEGQLDKEVARLEALKKVRLEDPDTFYIVDHDPDLEGVDVATNATTNASQFTRYTVAPTTAFSQSTRITGQTNRTRHKSSKKRAAGRKGTVDEYEYLLASLNRLIVRVDEKSAEAITLLRHLAVASPVHRDLAEELQSKIISFRTKLRNAVDDAWTDRAMIIEGVVESGGMGLDGGEGLDKARDAAKGVVAEWKGVGVLLG